MIKKCEDSDKELRESLTPAIQDCNEHAMTMSNIYPLGICEPIDRVVSSQVIDKMQVDQEGPPQQEAPPQKLQQPTGPPSDQPAEAPRGVLRMHFMDPVECESAIDDDFSTLMMSTVPTSRTMSSRWNSRIIQRSTKTTRSLSMVSSSS